MRESATPKLVFFEVRRSMEGGGFAVVWRGSDPDRAAAICSWWQDAVRSKGAFADLVEVAQ